MSAIQDSELKELADSLPGLGRTDATVKKYRGFTAPCNRKA